MFILKAEITEKAGHNVNPRLPGKTCILTSVVRSQHAIGQTRLKGSVYHVPVLVNTIRPSGLVGFIQCTGFVFYRTLYSFLSIGLC